MPAFSFQDVDRVSRVSPVGKQTSEGLARGADRMENARQADNQLSFNREQEARQAEQFAKTFGLNERKFNEDEGRLDRDEEAAAWQELKDARDRRDPEAIRTAQDKLRALGFDIAQAYTEEAAPTPAVEGTDAPEKVAAQTPEGPRQEVPVQKPAFMQGGATNAASLLSQIQANDAAGMVLPPAQQTQAARMSPAGAAAPPVGAQNMPAFMQPGPVELVGKAMEKESARAIQPQTLTPKEAAVATGLPIDKGPVEKQQLGVEGAKAAVGSAGQTPLEAAEAAKALGVQDAAAKQRTVIRDRDGKVVDVWSPQEQSDSEDAQWRNYAGAARQFSGANATKAWADAKQLVRGLPEHQREKEQVDNFFKLLNMNNALERSKQGRGGGGRAPANTFLQGARYGEQALGRFKELGNKYAKLKHAVKGLDLDNSISTGALVLQMATMFQSGVLSDKDFERTNVNPSVMSKLKDAIAKNTVGDLDVETKERLAEASTSLLGNIEDDADAAYQGVRDQWEMMRDYGGGTGAAEGYASSAMNIGALFPGMVQSEHFGIQNRAKGNSESSSIMNKFRGVKK